MKNLNEILNPKFTRYYYYNGQKVYLHAIQNRILITFKDSLNKNRQEQVLRELDGGDIYLEKFVSDNVDDNKFLLLNLDSNFRTRSEAGSYKIDHPEIASVSAVFTTESLGVQLGLTNQIFIGVKTNYTIDDLSIPFNKYGVIKYEEVGANIYLLTLEDNDVLDALDIANELNETTLCEFAEPNFFRSISKNQFVPNDPYFSYQWHLPLIGATEAWCWNSGANIKIGIMDVGINISHPDLQAHVVGTYDPTGRPLGADSHGTLCAGAALAIGNNGIGVTGVAYNASLHQIRIGYNPTSDPNSVNFYSTDAWFIGGLNYAYDNNVHIISCSFDFGSPSSSIDARIANFANLGRNGLGGIIVAATGNDNTLGNFGYPARNIQVIPIGASDYQDQKASFSNYGPRLAFVAPGVGIPTTSYDGSYNLFFSGTSAATPIVAGVVALVLASNANLTRTQVLEGLEKSCDRIGNYLYTQSEVGMWCHEVGYGRVNINNYFIAEYGIAGLNYFCGNSQQFNVSSLPSSLTVNWSSSNPNMPVSSTGLLSNVGGVPGRTELKATLSNSCISPRKKIIVAGALPEEVYVLSVYERSLNLEWAPGNSSTYNLSVKSDSNTPGSIPLSLYFGFAPSVGKSTLNPPPPLLQWDYRGWNLTDNGVSNVTIISAPSTWANINIYQNSMWFVTNGNASGVLKLNVHTPCGIAIVVFNIVGF